MKQFEHSMKDLLMKQVPLPNSFIVDVEHEIAKFEARIEHVEKLGVNASNLTDEELTFQF
jgi:hypothetical protein